MPFNVLLLPLLGGYIFLSFWNKTRFTTKRYSGERLLLHSAAVGVLLLAAYPVVLLIRSSHPAVEQEWSHFVPFPWTGTSGLAFLLGSTAWWPLNLFVHRDRAAKAAVQQWGDYLESLMDRAVRETRQVSITLKNRKVYIGFVLENFDPVYDRKYVMVLPLMSGYRASENHSLTLTTDYSLVLDRVADTMASGNADVLGDVPRMGGLNPEDFQVVLPVAEIQSASLWDWDAYDVFRQAETA